MFIKAFSFKKSNPDKQSEYTKVSYFIKDGSVLDRRKNRKDRRITADRRKNTDTFYPHKDRRVLKTRRGLSTRRNSDKRLTDVAENIDALELNANSVKELIQEQMDVIEKIGGLSISAKEMESHEIKRFLQKLSCDIRFQNKKEQHFLRLYIDKVVINISNIGGGLSELHSDNFTKNSQILELVNKYQTADISKKTIGGFMLDMTTVHEKLRECLNIKQSHLYPKYLTLD